MQRTFLASGIPALAMTCAVAQSYPSKPIRIIAAQTAGGVTDALARTFAQKFLETWKQPVVVENRAGAGGAIGTEVAAKAAASAGKPAAGARCNVAQALEGDACSPDHDRSRNTGL